MEQEDVVHATADVGTQTSVELLSRSVSAQTYPPQTCNIGVQTDNCHFFHEKKNFE